MLKPAPHTAESADLARRTEEWRRLAILGNPLVNADYIRVVADEIVKRAEILATLHPLNFYTVAVFLLERSAAWVMTGLPINEIGPKLPKNMTQLGVLKMSEGSDVNYGRALTAEELKPVVKHFQKIIH